MALRTADSITEDYFPEKYYGETLRNDVRKAINEARKEAIEEAADVAANEVSGKLMSDDMKETVLKLIDKIK